jgi:Arc/MetJ family transcription regulator
MTKQNRPHVSADWDDVGIMRTTIEIDDRLMREAMRCSGTRTKKAAVEAALQLLVRTYAQGAIARHRGKVIWEGNLKQSHSSQTSE